MKKTFLLLLGLGLAGAHCFADDVDLAGKFDHKMGEGKHFRPMGHCHLDLSEEQLAKMHSAKFKFEESQIDLEARLKHSRLAYRRVLTNPEADYRAAKSAANEVASNLTNLISARENFKAEVAFKIFTADQRKEAQKCHLHRGGHGPRFEAGPRPLHRMGEEEEPANLSDGGDELTMIDLDE